MSFCSSGQGANGATPALGSGAASGATPAAATASNSMASPTGGTDGSPPTSTDTQSWLDKFIKAKTAVAGMQSGGGMPGASFGNAPTNVGSAGMATPGANIPWMQDPGASKYAQGGGGLHQVASAAAGKSGNL